MSKEKNQVLIEFSRYTNNLNFKLNVYKVWDVACNVDTRYDIKYNGQLILPNASDSEF